MFLASAGVTSVCLAVMAFWLQKTQSFGQPLCGMKIGMIACFFMGLLYHKLHSHKTQLYVIMTA